MEVIKINSTDIFLDDMGQNRGKLTISDTYGHNYSAYWGSMGCNLRDFIKGINSEYFANNLIDPWGKNEIDVKKTFAQIRKHIREEIMPWHQHMEFQKEMRITLNNFQRECEEFKSEQYFVDRFFSGFVNDLDYHLINDWIDRKDIEGSFRGISEQWYFISKKHTTNYNWLVKLHKQLIRVL